MLVIKFKEGRCEELSLDGVSLMKGCRTIEFEAQPGEVPTLTLVYPIVGVEIESDEANISREYEIIKLKTPDERYKGGINGEETNA